ncbi:MAG: hypothetical protein K6B14_05055, partial [Lachnospiraceae bacterium]|nr:hypothetical protein [Lachnospiraceae bacterium]
ELINNNPVFGLGMEGIRARGYWVYVGNARPHNEFLQYALFYGIPAGVLYFSGCLSAFLHDLKYKNELDGITVTFLVVAFGYLVSSFFGLTLYSTAPYLFITLGLGIYSNKKGSPE